MDSKLLKHFSKFETLTPEEIDAIDATMDEKSFKKNTVLVEAGKKNFDVFFVLEGIVRQYIFVDGEEKTTAFFSTGEWVVASNNLNPEQPAAHFIECATPCTLAVGNSTKGEELYHKYPKLANISRKVMESIFIAQQERITQFLSSEPKDRYLHLLKNNSELFQNIPQYQIASYIGVTPESLSRIRKRIEL